MTLPRVSDLEVSGKKVIVRLDLDLPAGKAGLPTLPADFTRLGVAKETLEFLLQNKAKIIVIGHRGQPNGVISQSLSLNGVASKIEKLTAAKTRFVYDLAGQETKAEAEKLSEGEILVLENLRFDQRETLDFATRQEAQTFAKNLASLADFYVNEAFASSHRNHVSIVGLSKLLPHAAGFRFIKEVGNLSYVLKNPQRPVVILISGIKKDKVEMVGRLSEKFDKILVGGRLPLLMQKLNIKNQKHSSKMKIASLTSDLLDVDENSIKAFKKEISAAGTVVLAGVLGKYEDEGHRQGTKEVFEAVAASSAYKIAGGGDTEAALTIFGLTEKFDWISVGGGAMIEFLINETLPGIEALK